MRLKKIAAAAVAMVMAVSMMAVPVFADAGKVSIDENPTAFDNTNQAKTEVKLVYSDANGNLSVTVPLHVTFAVDSQGKLTYPDNYKIVNNSVVPVHVTDIKVTMLDQDYVLVNTTPAANAQEVKLSMTATSNEKSDTVNFVATKGGTNVEQTFTKTGTNCEAWNIPAGKKLSGDVTGTALPLTFGTDGAVGSIKADWANEATQFCNIIYTVAAGVAK